MNKTMLASLFAFFVGISLIGTGMAFAQTSGDVATTIGDAISAAFVSGGTGLLGGALVSFIRVIGKNLQGQSEPLVIAQLLLTAGVGFAIGELGRVAGFSETQTLTSVAFVVWVITQLVFPVFQNRLWKRISLTGTQPTKTS